MSQLALPLTLADHAVFDSFWPAGNEPAVAYLKDLATAGQGTGAWLFGPAASGKTHLLQAVCERAGDEAIYLPFDLVAEAGSGVLEGLATRRFICIDDVDHAAGQASWEQALFRLFNQLADAGGTLLLSANSTVRESAFELDDLRSRFSLLPPFQLRLLQEADRLRALQLRSRHRGLKLPDDAARYLLNRSRRDMASLYGLLDQLDAEALRAQRRLTVPFIKEVLPRLS